MAQTINFLSGLKRLAPLGSARTTARAVLDWTMNHWGAYARFYFPEKYIWEWKLEMLSGRYEQDTVQAFKNLIQPGMTVVDIGAHIGFYTRLFSRLAGPTGTIYAFEPEPDNFSLLQKNTQNLSNVRIFSDALSDTEGTIHFYKVEGSTACHSLIKKDVPAEDIEVKTTKLDTFLAKNNISGVDVIKIDVEGAEPKTFKGMENLLKRPDAPIIVSELNREALSSGGTDPIEFLKSVTALGFHMYQILPDGSLREFQIQDVSSLTYYKAKQDYANIVFKK